MAKFCANCGESVLETEKFCDKCGNAHSAPAPKSKEEAVVVDAKVEEVAKTAEVVPPSSNPYGTASLVLGICIWGVGLIPWLGWLLYLPAAITGLVFGLKHHKTCGRAKAGMILCIISLSLVVLLFAIGIIAFGAFASIVASAF